MAKPAEVKKPQKRRLGQWLDDLAEAKKNGSYVHFETRDGSVRSGRLTGLRTHDMNFNGEKQTIIDEFELNGDETDCIPFNVLAKITIE